MPPVQWIRPEIGRAWVAVVATAGLVGGGAVAVPSAEAQVTERQRIESFGLPSSLVDTGSPGGRLAGGRTVPKVNVLLPDGYGEHPGRRYPVLWLLHGASGGADNWLGNIRELAKGFPGVIVMPDGGLNGMYTDWWNGGRRGDPAWASYHLNVLKSAIESRYRILSGRRWHAIGGISMGGQGALRYAAMLPGYFGSVATFSAAMPNMQAPETQIGLAILTASGSVPPGVTYGALLGPAQGAYAEGNSPQALAANYGHTRMYLTSGNGVNCPQDPVNPRSIAIDLATEVAIHLQEGPFAQKARGAGADVTAKTTCGVHTFGVWDRAFTAARAWGLFKPVPERPTRWTYRTVATAGQMWSFAFRFSAPPSAVVTFTRNGGRISANGKGAVRLMGANGCLLDLRLPTTKDLPRACR